MEEYVPPRDIVNGVAVDKAVFVPAVILKGGVNPAVPIPMFPEYSANPIVPSAFTLKDGIPDISDTENISPDKLSVTEKEIGGIECLYIGPGEHTEQEQVQIVQDLIAKGVDGIAVASSNAAAMAKAVKGTNIPIITWDSDLLNKDGFLYDYSGLDTSGTSVSQAQKDLLDGDYESNANTPDSRQIKIMPSLGFGLGYQITPSFSIGVEHRTTFTLNDVFEGAGTEVKTFNSDNSLKITTSYLIDDESLDADGKVKDAMVAGLEGMTVPLRVAVMGCVVNGPGEAREADLGVASGNGKGQIFVKGEVIKTVPESMIVQTLIEEAMRLAEEMEAAGVASGEPVVSTS